MGLKYADQVARALQATSLTITPKETESIRINKIGFTRPAADGYATIKIGRMIVGYIPVRIGATMIPFAYDVHGASVINPYDYGEIAGIDLKYPIATGENFNVTSGVTTDIFVDYDIFDAGDVSNTEPNGIGSNELTYYVNLTNGSAITTETSRAYHKLDKNMNPIEFPRFPLERVPSGFEYTIKAIGAMALSRGNGTANIGYTEVLRMKYNRQVLYDPTEAGFQVLGDSTFITNAYSYTQTLNELPLLETPVAELYKFDPVLIMKEGDVFDTEYGIKAGAAGTIEAEKLLVYYITTVKKGA